MGNTALDLKNAATVDYMALGEDDPRERADAQRDGRTMRGFLAEHPELFDDVGCSTRLDHLLFDIFDAEDAPLIPYDEICERVDRAYGRTR